MEKDIAVGPLGSLALSFRDGKFVLSLSGGSTGTAVSISEDAGVLIDLLQAEVAKLLPVTAPFDPLVFGMIKAAVQKIS